MKILLTLSLVLVCLTSQATAQFPDKIIYQGKEYALYSNPMEEYFQQYPEHKPKAEVMSTALWRGYVATFEMRDSALYLKDLQIMVNDTLNAYAWKSVMRDTSGIKLSGMKINWFTGLLVLPHGKLVNYVHLGYASSYSKYFLLEVREGRLTQERFYTYKKYEYFKDKQFEAYKQTKEYAEIVEALKKDGYDQEFIDQFLKDAIVEYSSEILVEE